MCKAKANLTDEQKEELKCARREKRSAFLSRMVDEFKKIVLIALFPLFAGTIIWCLVLYTLKVTPTVSPTIPIAAMGFLSGAYFVYCSSAAKEKDSLNKNGLVKGKDGVIAKAAETVSTIIKTVTGNTTTATTTAKDDSDDSDAKG
jgi:hypothetical protein